MHKLHIKMHLRDSLRILMIYFQVNKLPKVLNEIIFVL